MHQSILAILIYSCSRFPLDFACSYNNLLLSIKSCNLNSDFLHSAHGITFAADVFSKPNSTTEPPTHQAVNQTTK